MERFYNDDSDDEESFFGSYEEFDDEENGEVVGYIDQQGVLDLMHMDIAQSELNQKLLESAIRIAESNWFWKFKTAEVKLAEIELIYEKLLLLANEEDEDGPQDNEDED